VTRCDYKSKDNSSLKRHKAFKHDIDVKCRKCDQCEYKSKKTSKPQKTRSPPPLNKRKYPYRLFYLLTTVSMFGGYDL